MAEKGQRQIILQLHIAELYTCNHKKRLIYYALFISVSLHGTPPSNLMFSIIWKDKG